MPGDDLLVGDEVSPGVHRALRRVDEREAEEVRFVRVKDGDPIPPGQELIHVGKPGRDGWRKVTTLYRSGPAQVATPSYRENYDRVFGSREVN